MNHLLRILAVLCLASLCGCAGVPTREERVALANTIARESRWHPIEIAADPFRIEAWVPDTPTAANDLAIYIEGDGLSWLAPDAPSQDPTPLDPIALRLAIAQPSGVAAYLARPCQYSNQAKACEQRFWTSERFGPSVVEAMDRAVEALKRRFAATHLTLVGYSGGAAIVVLLAARRTDVVRLVTVAGNIDHRSWTEYHRVSPLRGSLDPSKSIEQLAALAQWHFVGTGDRVVPMSLTEQWVGRIPTARLIPMSGFDHTCCWVQSWPELWQRIE